MLQHSSAKPVPKDANFAKVPLHALLVSLATIYELINFAIVVVRRDTTKVMKHRIAKNAHMIVIHAITTSAVSLATVQLISGN